MIMRPAGLDDVPGMAIVLNAVIAIGGTTAHEVAKTDDQIRSDYVTGTDVLSSIVADESGRILGWQAVEFWQGEGHIGTFVQPGLQAKGIGAGLFAATLAALEGAAISCIIASIRADNVPGLAYYARIGFRDIAQDPDFALSDGQVVGRVHRRFDL
jgi:L-amino acid N-acyltransferase YncA